MIKSSDKRKSDGASRTAQQVSERLHLPDCRRSNPRRDGDLLVCTLGEVVPFPKRDDWEPELTKKQIAHALGGYTTRWVEIQVGNGMPAHWRGSRRSFYLSECRRWLKERRGK